MNARTAVVTGAARGLGYAVSEHLAGEGLNLLVLDLDEEGVCTAAKTLGGGHAEVEYQCLDVSDQAQCEAAVDFARGRFGTLDVLVNCAGVYPRRDILSISKEDWHLDLDVNLIGTYFMMAAAAKVMKQGSGGRIVNVSSIDAYIPHPGNAHYAASKAAVVSLTRSFALAVAADGILVNSVAPGPLATEKAKSMDWYEGAVAALPTKAPIEPAEIARTVAFLASPDNHSITAEDVIVSGGAVVA